MMMVRFACFAQAHRILSARRGDSFHTRSEADYAIATLLQIAHLFLRYWEKKETINKMDGKSSFKSEEKSISTYSLIHILKLTNMHEDKVVHRIKIKLVACVLLINVVRLGKKICQDLLKKIYDTA